jgi:Rod binding domain-containing protein
MGSIDAAMLQYNNQPLRVPSAAKQVQGSGAQIAAGVKIDKKSPLYDQCRDFESIFVKMMLGEMQKTVHKGELMNGGYAEEIFQDMLNEEYSKSMAKSADFGIADSLYRQLSRG